MLVELLDETKIEPSGFHFGAVCDFGGVCDVQVQNRCTFGLLVGDIQIKIILRVARPNIEQEGQDGELQE